MYQPKSFEHLLGLKGFSDQLLKNHFTLYQGYVNNTNRIAEALAGLLKQGKTGTPEYAELKRRFGWEFNGMRLHEHYFGNMTRESAGLSSSSEIYRKIVEDFGS
ncbi:MAG: superoxide dismutase, partial [Thermoproteota archaeon]